MHPGRLAGKIAILGLLGGGCGGTPVSRAGPLSATPMETEVVLLGSAHDLSRSDSFSPSRWRAVVEQFGPSVVLIELPTDWFDGDVPAPGARRILEDGSPSPLRLAWQHCQRAHVRCAPFDLRGRNDFYVETHFLAREDAFWDAILAQAKTRSPAAYAAGERLSSLKATCSRGAPEVVNSTLCDQIVEAEHGQREELARELLSTSSVPDPGFLELSRQEWTDRNRAMATNICEAAHARPGGRVLVVVGHEHRYILRRMLADTCLGISLRDLGARTTEVTGDRRARAL